MYIVQLNMIYLELISSAGDNKCNSEVSSDDLRNPYFFTNNQSQMYLDLPQVPLFEFWASCDTTRRKAGKGKNELRLRTYPGLVLDRSLDCVHVQICLLSDLSEPNC